MKPYKITIKPTVKFEIEYEIKANSKKEATEIAENHFIQMLKDVFGEMIGADAVEFRPEEGEHESKR